MFAPVAFLPLLAIPRCSSPDRCSAVNVFSSFPYTREIRYHYSSLVLVGVILATVEAIAWVAVKKPGLVRFLVGLVVASSLAATVAWGPSPIGVKYHSGVWPPVWSALNQVELLSPGAASNLPLSPGTYQRWTTSVEQSFSTTAVSTGTTSS